MIYNSPFGRLKSVLTFKPFRLAVHCVEEEERSSLFPPLLPSFRNGAWNVHSCAVGPGRLGCSARLHQRFRSRFHVFLLLPHRFQAGIETVNLVEEAHHTVPIGNYGLLQLTIELIAASLSSSLPFWLLPFSELASAIIAATLNFGFGFL